MNITLEGPAAERRFKTKLVGVSYANDDGVSRQDVLRALHPGSKLLLRRESENPHDSFAILVLAPDGRVAGYLPGGDQRLAHHLDSGGQAEARVVATIGSDLEGETIGCVIEVDVNESDLDWDTIIPILDQSQRIKRLLDRTKKLEERNPSKAIANYRDAVRQIVELDRSHPIAPYWRRVRHPVNQFSRFLEQVGKSEESLEVIAGYDQYTDSYGLTKVDEQNLRARRKRLAKLIGRLPE